MVVYFKGAKVDIQYYGPEHALRWAYEIASRPIVKISSVNSMRGADHGVGETPHERNLEANNILGLCERTLSPLHLAYVQLNFGRDAKGFEVLVPHVAAFAGTGVHSRRAIQQVIRMYCGEPGGIREIKKLMSCGLFKAALFKNRVYDVLDSIHAQAMDDFRSALMRREDTVNVYSGIPTIKDIPGTPCRYPNT